MHANYYAFATPLLLCLTTLVCMWLWNQERRHHYLCWLAAAQGLLALGMSLQMLLDAAQRLRYSPLTTSIYLLAISCLALSLCARLHLRLRWWWLAAFNLGALLAMAHVSQWPSSLTARLVVMSCYVGLVHGTVLLHLRPGDLHHPLDRVTALLYAVFGLSMLCRPLLAPLQSPDVAQTWISQHLAWWLTSSSVLLLCAGLTLSLSASALLATNQRLRQERDYDPLTGTLTRRAFEDSCGAHLPHSLGFRALVLADIDHFKRINDQFGHACGDQVLQHVGHTLRQQLRASDVVGRIGGEEFALALRHVDLPRARKLLGRLSAHLRRTPHHLPADMPAITASFGLVLVHPEESLASALQRADRLLYCAKAAGRNRVISEALPAQDWRS